MNKSTRRFLQTAISYCRDRLSNFLICPRLTRSGVACHFAIASQKSLLELVERILVYKLPQTRREEIERMFSLDDLRQTRVWQEAQQEARLETKLETVPRLQGMGLTIEQIAEALELTVEQVRQALSTDSN
ncbi:MAG: DUF2887 domain-containing protein [Jaaginema sp. PMC 1079.18]|nr:DUF2887 domain-containing protein [Jaaginema sp. PMC 1079.18]MEC4867648.1 DUF2887 domain-containing protein [Jaaginema sp. PMC 1078.18]